MRISTVADVVKRMRAIAAQEPAADGAGVFNGVYLQVTEMMLDRLTTGGTFHDDAFVADLDVRFARYWFDAYDASGDKPTVWAPLFAARARHDILPIEFALAGMNSHIEHDLPLAVVATCAARRCTPDSVRADYEKINNVLASVEAEIRQSFFNDIEKSIDDPVEPLVHLVTSWDIAKARDFAWLTAQTLWELRRGGDLFDEYAAGLAHTVGMGSQLLLTPLA